MRALGYPIALGFVALLLPLNEAAAATAAGSERSAFWRDEQSLADGVATAGTVEEKAAAARVLARFYLDRELYVEALAALAAVPADDEVRLMTARAQFALQRYDRTLEALSDERLSVDGAAAALRAMALARLGAFSAARPEFERSDPDRLASSRLARDWRLLKGETALAMGDLATARAEAAETAREHGADAASSDIALAAATLALAEGVRGARDLMRELTKSGEPGVAATAELRLAAADYSSGALPRARALERLGPLRLKWTGDAFEREWLAATIAATPKHDAPTRITLLKRLADRHARSDAAAIARGQLAEALQVLLADAERDPREVARQFYECADFAPQGAEGDLMVRQLADRLVRLDLLAEAGEILDHQVFRRLRGTERARVAADLAQVRLDDRRPEEALRVLRATRSAGLDAAAAERRRVLEAIALERTGAPDAALALLDGAGEGALLDLRAGIEWRAKRWSEAAASYTKMLKGSVLDDGGREALLRAAAAYVLAGDAPGFAALRADAEARFGGFPEAEVLSFMDLQGSGGGAGFLDAYRRIYGATAS